jgi:hypothetical protein
MPFCLLWVVAFDHRQVDAVFADPPARAQQAGAGLRFLEAAAPASPSRAAAMMSDRSVLSQQEVMRRLRQRSGGRWGQDEGVVLGW